MVTKESLLKEIAEKAKAEALRQGLDEFITENLINEVHNIIEDIFYSIKIEDIEDGTTISHNPVTSWNHRYMPDQENDWRYMSFSRAELRDAAERYLDRPWMHCRNIDWLLLNMLTYAECQATLDFIRANFMPWSKYISNKMDSSLWDFGTSLWLLLVFLVKWSIWLAIFGATFLFASIVPIAFSGITIWWQWRKWSARKKIDNVMSSMFATTYSAFSTVSQSWKIVWECLNKSREKGAVWDGVIYRLVEERMLKK